MFSFDLFHHGIHMYLFFFVKIKDYDDVLDLELDSMDKFVLQCLAFYQVWKFSPFSHFSVELVLVSELKIMYFHGNFQSHQNMHVTLVTVKRCRKQQNPSSLFIYSRKCVVL